MFFETGARREFSAAGPNIQLVRFLVLGFTDSECLDARVLDPESLNKIVSHYERLSVGEFPNFIRNDYKPQFDRSYYFRKPLKLPAGTKIEAYPANAGSVSLLEAN